MTEKSVALGIKFLPNPSILYGLISFLSNLPV